MFEDSYSDSYSGGRELSPAEAELEICNGFFQGYYAKLDRGQAIPPTLEAKYAEMNKRYEDAKKALAREKERGRDW